jgi:hypothetical protein
MSILSSLSSTCLLRVVSTEGAGEDAGAGAGADGGGRIGAFVALGADGDDDILRQTKVYPAGVTSWGRRGVCFVVFFFCQSQTAAHLLPLQAWALGVSECCKNK